MKVKKAFTLVELLVVIAIIAVLMSILMPALQSAREQGMRAVCLNNVHGMAMAYLLYSEDNDGRLVGGYQTMPGTAPPYDSPWLCPPMLADGTYFGRGSATGEGGDPATQEDRFRGIRAGKLFEYTQTTDIYHCPADRRVREGTYLGTSQVYRLYVSYGPASGLNGGSAGHLTRMSEIKRPGSTYNFVETYSDGWVHNEGGGFFIENNLAPGRWWSVIAIWHGAAGILGYADGHANRIIWQDERTLDMKFSRDPVTNLQPDNPDLHYMFRNHPLSDSWDLSWMEY